jgi:hypothetical protein
VHNSLEDWTEAPFGLCRDAHLCASTQSSPSYVTRVAFRVTSQQRLEQLAVVRHAQVEQLVHDDLDLGAEARRLRQEPGVEREPTAAGATRLRLIDVNASLCYHQRCQLGV